MHEALAWIRVGPEVMVHRNPSECLGISLALLRGLIGPIVKLIHEHDHRDSLARAVLRIR
jgi:hypothetical protein